MPAPKGNQNAAKGKQWAAAIERALSNRSRAEGKVMLDEVANKLIDLCMEGDLSAIKELGDRLDGKAKQQIEASGEGGGAIVFVLNRDDQAL